MNRFLYILLAGLCLTACHNEQALRQRAAELCSHVPYHENYQEARAYLTNDFYARLDTLFCLPDSTEVLHEWEFWFCTADGTPVNRCACEILSVQRHGSFAVAQVLVTPDDSDYEPEQHTLSMRRVRRTWLLDDFDDHKADAERRIQRAKEGK